MCQLTNSLKTDFLPDLLKYYWCEQKFKKEKTLFQKENFKAFQSWKMN